MKKWDGVYEKYTYHIDKESQFEYFIDDQNTVYVKSKSSDDMKVWCPESKLQAHLQRLYLINKNLVSRR